MSDCVKCWSTPCVCGHEFRDATAEYKEKMTKSINGFTIKDVFDWLAQKDYLSDKLEVIYKEFTDEKSAN